MEVLPINFYISFPVILADLLKNKSIIDFVMDKWMEQAGGFVGFAKEKAKAEKAEAERYKAAKASNTKGEN